MTNEEAIRLLKAMMNEMILVFDRDRKKALNMSIEALEKQIPKKPVMDYLFPEELREVIERTDIELAKSKTECCPVCGRSLGVKAQTRQKYGDFHCKGCGQAIGKNE